MKESEDMDWAQVKARVPKELHRKAKIASAVIGKTVTELVIEALEGAIAKADERYEAPPQKSLRLAESGAIYKTGSQSTKNTEN